MFNTDSWELGDTPVSQKDPSRAALLKLLFPRLRFRYLLKIILDVASDRCPECINVSSPQGGRGWGEKMAEGVTLNGAECHSVISFMAAASLAGFPISWSVIIIVSCKPHTFPFCLTGSNLGISKYVRAVGQLFAWRLWWWCTCESLLCRCKMCSMHMGEI